MGLKSGFRVFWVFRRPAIDIRHSSPTFPCYPALEPLSSPLMSHPVADYLHELYLIYGVSVPETSGYLALSNIEVLIDSKLLKRLVTVC